MLMPDAPEIESKTYVRRRAGATAPRPCACTVLPDQRFARVLCARSRAEGEARVASVTMVTAASTVATATATTTVETARPTKSGPKHMPVQKRTAECQAKRDALRREAWARKKEADTLQAEMKTARVGDDAGPSKSNSRGVENANVQADIQAQGRHEVEGAIGTASRKVGGGFLKPEIEKRRGLCRTTQGGWYTVLFEVNR